MLKPFRKFSNKPALKKILAGSFLVFSERQNFIHAVLVAFI